MGKKKRKLKSGQQSGLKFPRGPNSKVARLSSSIVHCPHGFAMPKSLFMSDRSPCARNHNLAAPKNGARRATPGDPPAKAGPSVNQAVRGGGGLKPASGKHRKLVSGSRFTSVITDGEQRLLNLIQMLVRGQVPAEGRRFLDKQIERLKSGEIMPPEFLIDLQKVGVRPRVFKPPRTRKKRKARSVRTVGSGQTRKPGSHRSP